MKSLFPKLYPIPTVKNYFVAFCAEDEGNGSIWSVNRGLGEIKTPIKLKPFKHPYGTVGVNIMDKKGKRKFFSVAKLIALAFHGVPKYEARAIMKDKNGSMHPSNLRWSEKVK